MREREKERERENALIDTFHVQSQEARSLGHGQIEPLQKRIDALRIRRVAVVRKLQSTAQTILNNRAKDTGKKRAKKRRDATITEATRKRERERDRARWSWRIPSKTVAHRQ